MDYSYTYLLSQFPNNKIDITTLSEQIMASAITVAFDYIAASPAQATIYFKAELSPTDVSVLDEVVAAHTGVPGIPEIQIVKSEVLTEHIKFVEAGDTTQGMYAVESIIVDVSANETEKYTDFSWQFDVALMSGTLDVTDDMVGDKLMVEVGPNTLIGAIIQPLSVGDTSMYVSPTVLENIKTGFFIGLYGGPGNNGTEISQVIDVDAPNYALTINPSDVSANAGSYIAMCAKIIQNITLTAPTTIEIGKTITTGQRIPRGLPVRVHYWNNNGIAKIVSFLVEYLY